MPQTTNADISSAGNAALNELLSRRTAPRTSAREVFGAVMDRQYEEELREYGSVFIPEPTYKNRTTTRTSRTANYATHANAETEVKYIKHTLSDSVSEIEDYYDYRATNRLPWDIDTEIAESQMEAHTEDIEGFIVTALAGASITDTTFGTAGSTYISATGVPTGTGASLLVRRAINHLSASLRTNKAMGPAAVRNYGEGPNAWMVLHPLLNQVFIEDVGEQRFAGLDNLTYTSGSIYATEAFSGRWMGVDIFESPLSPVAVASTNTDWKFYGGLSRGMALSRMEPTVLLERATDPGVTAPLNRRVSIQDYALTLVKGSFLREYTIPED